MPNYHFSTSDYERFYTLRPAIQRRLEDFRSVAPEDWFYELCYCICTPQSKAEHANIVVHILQRQDFLSTGFDPTYLLRSPLHYIRFHATKAQRLLQARQQWSTIEPILRSSLTAEQKRDWLAYNVSGIGWKEASHFLRNIGYTNLPILDRHILKHLVRCRVFDTVPRVASKAQYYAASEGFKRFAEYLHIPLDELDLYFWALETGRIRK
ncbi:MAG: hypothetical protein RML40_09805 [Bacteroidota bacterium]|nr:hypothetical protein [Candidatus Kapabacteria bacterium]MDW8220812.1 hypothetical protein [Bacteroidota bacterium]